MKSTGKKPGWATDLMNILTRTDKKPEGWLTAPEMGKLIGISNSSISAKMCLLRSDNPELAVVVLIGQRETWCYDWPKISKMIGYKG